MISKKILKSLLLITFFIVFISACNDDTNPFVADYSDAPPLPDTTAALSKMSFDSGLIYYKIIEGSSESFDVTIRDNIIVYYTTRLADGDIIASSYVNGSTSPVRVSSIGNQNIISFVGDGFVTGVLGMKEGEQRVLVIPPDLNSTSETLIFDVELVTIEY